MENEIKVNEYIRTKRGIIDKAVKILDDYIFLESKFFITEYGESFTFIKKTDVVKHSPNIIDLICEGDYVNRYIVRRTYLDGETHYIKLGEQITGNRTYNDDIKSIVTKEQFESISYKVKE